MQGMTRQKPEELRQLGVDLKTPLVVQPALRHPLQALVQGGLLLPSHKTISFKHRKNPPDDPFKICTELILCILLPKSNED